MTTTTPRRPASRSLPSREQFWLERGDVLRLRGVEVRYGGNRVRFRDADGNRVDVVPTSEHRATVHVRLVRTGPEPQYGPEAGGLPPAPTCVVPRGAGCVVFPGELGPDGVALHLAGLVVRYQRGRVTFVGPVGNQIDVMPSSGGLALAWVIVATAGPSPECIHHTTRPPGDAAPAEGPAGRTGGATEPPLCRFGPGGDFVTDFVPALKTPRRARP